MLEILYFKDQNEVCIFIFNIKILFTGLIRLAQTGGAKLQETAHEKSYLVDTSTKYRKYIFQYENGSFFFIKCCLGKPRGESKN